VVFATSVAFLFAVSAPRPMHGPVRVSVARLVLLSNFRVSLNENAN
jgi:hypothetical protein